MFHSSLHLPYSINHLKMCISSKKTIKWPTVIGSHTWIRQSQRLKFTSWKCCSSGSVKQNQLIWQFEHDKFPCLRKMAGTLGCNHFTEADRRENCALPDRISFTGFSLSWSFLLIQYMTFPRDFKNTSVVPVWSVCLFGGQWLGSQYFVFHNFTV